MKSSRLMYFTAIGFLGGLGGWALIQVAFHGMNVLLGNEAVASKFFWANTVSYEGALLGLSVGMVLQARTSLWYHHEWVSIATKMLIGALLGMFSGAISFVIGQSLHDLSPIVVSHLVSWTLLGLSLGGTTALLQSRSEIFWPRLLGGIIGGAIAGVIFEFLMLYQLTGPDHFFGLLVFGMSTSFTIGLFETNAASFALKVVTGKLEGQVFLLDQNKFTLGYNSQNDIVLNGYAEVCDVHAFIQKKDRQIFIENVGNGGEILVNYRLVDQQAMKKGDVIKLGTALLQYYEI